MPNSTATNATFNVGDLAGQWGLPRNLDIGKRHWFLKVRSFDLVSSSAAPTIVEVNGVGWPSQYESWDSSTSGPSTLLTVCSGADVSWAEGDDIGITLNSLPSGILGIQLVSRDMQAALDADTSLAWKLVVTMSPADLLS
jgi:hypothetical protein